MAKMPLILSQPGMFFLGPVGQTNGTDTMVIAAQPHVAASPKQDATMSFPRLCGTSRLGVIGLFLQWPWESSFEQTTWRDGNHTLVSQKNRLFTTMLSVQAVSRDAYAAAPLVLTKPVEAWSGASMRIVALLSVKRKSSRRQHYRQCLSTTLCRSSMLADYSASLASPALEYGACTFFWRRDPRPPVLVPKTTAPTEPCQPPNDTTWPAAASPSQGCEVPRDKTQASKEGAISRLNMPPPQEQAKNRSKS